jgi:hypothetical protein
MPYYLLFAPLVLYLLYALVNYYKTSQKTPALIRTADRCHPIYCQDFICDGSRIICSKNPDHQKNNAYSGEGCSQSRARINEREVAIYEIYHAQRHLFWDRLISIIAIIITALVSLLTKD